MPASHERRDPGQDSAAIPGRRAVLETLRAQRPLRKLLVSRTAHGATIRDILQEARRRGVVVQFVDSHRLDRLAPGAHQGVVALASSSALVEVDEMLRTAQTRGELPFLLVLDGVEDPTNLGALIRTAEGAGVHGVIVPKRRAAGLTPAVAHASAGAVAHIAVAAVTNLVRTLLDLKAAGLWIVGTDPEARDLYYHVRLTPPLAIVMGGEGRGMSRLVGEHCDLRVRLPMRGKVAALNVAVAAGVLLYEVVRQMEAQGVAGAVAQTNRVTTR